MSATNCGLDKSYSKKPKIQSWVKLCERNMHTLISGPVLAMKAKYFFKETSRKDVASKGWLEQFKNHHRIRSMTVIGEKLVNDAS